MINNTDMNYSVEDIYNFSGQFDKVVSITFKPNSAGYVKYGQSITGMFVYTPNERTKLQQIVDESNDVKTDGYIRFNELLNNVSPELKGELLEKGVLNTDIQSILQGITNIENVYTKQEIRELPKPLEIKVDLSDWDDNLTLGLYQQYMKIGYTLCPFENDENIALILMRLKDENPQKEKIINDFIDKETGQLKSSLRFQYLKKKFLTEAGLTDDETRDLESILKEIADYRANILKTELLRSTEKFKELGINYPDNLKRIIALSSSFQDERLTHNKKPVWWDYERFIHIYIRHVSEIQTGERFEKKTVFQYNIKDIRQLVIGVLKTIEDEIQEHFEKFPNKPFKRHGEMSVYYQGDYYVIDVASDGRLMAFYKKE